MPYHKAKKVVIIAEKIITEHICEIIESAGARGYTIVPAGGKGMTKRHFTTDRASVVDDFTTVRIEVVVGSQEVAEQIGETVLKECFSNYSGIVYLEDVEVLRQDKFKIG